MKESNKTEGKVGSDIEFICRKAAMLAIREYVEKKLKSLKITKKHFKTAFKLLDSQQNA